MNRGSQITACMLLLASAGLNSCITKSDELDLNKDISLDMQIGAGGVSVPIGSLSKIYVDSLLKVGDGEIDLDTLPGGVYGFTMSDKIDDVKVNIDKILINIPSPSINELSTSFDNPTPDDITVPKVDDGTIVEISSVNIDAINDKFPAIRSSYETPSYSVPGTGSAIPVNVPVTIDEQTIGFQFDYTLPDKVSRLNNVWFGPSKYLKAGQTMLLNVDMSGVYSLVNDPVVTIDALSIVFPSNFTVQKSDALDAFISPSCVTVAGNVLSISGAQISGLSAGNTTLPVSFMVSNADFSSYTGKIEYNDEIKYSLSLNVQGEVNYTGTRTFKVGVGIDETLSLAEVSVDTKAVNFEVGNASISSSYKVTGMDGISSIKKIAFNSETSKIYLSVSDLGLDPFSFSSEEGEAYMQFQSNMEFVNSCVDENGATAGKWDAQTPGKLLIDLSKAAGHTIELKVKSIDLSGYVIDKDTKSMTIPNTVGYGGTAVIAAQDGLGLQAVENLGNRNFNVSVWGSLEVDNAELVTDAISTEIKDSTTITIDENIDKSVKSLKRIDLVKPSGVDVRLEFCGIPESLPELAFSDVRIEFPDFIKMEYSGSDSRVQVLGSSLLRIDGSLNASEMEGDGFVIAGLKISGIEFDDYVETKNGRLVLEDLKVRIEGGVNANNFVVNSNELEDVSVKPSITIDPIEVKAVYGKFTPSIDDIHQAVGLSLGEDLDFMKDGENSLSLSDPELVLDLTSSVTIPMVAGISLSSKDDKGNWIARDVKPEGGTIRIPACDSLADSRNIKIIIYSSQRTVPESRDSVFVRIANLSDLMTTIPDSIFFDLTVDADQSVNHYIDLTRELSVAGSYNVTIPLSFENVHFEYSDTIADLAEQLEDISDMVGDASIMITAKLESTVPFGITVSAVALDANGREIKDIKVGTCEVKPGDKAGTVSDVVLSVSAKNGALAALDALKISASLDSGNSADGSALAKGQYVWLKDVVLKFPEGIVVDFTDTIDKE